MIDWEQVNGESPQNLHKIAYKSACMAHRPEMFGPTRGFSGMVDSMERYFWRPRLILSNAEKIGRLNKSKK